MRLEPGLLGCDIDGVVADFTGAVEKWVYKEYGIEPIPILDWDWFEHWPNGRKVWNDVWNRGCRKEGLLRSCRPVPGAVSGINRLLTLGWEVVFITHRKDDFAVDTLSWLDGHGLPPVAIHSDDKSVVGADLYIDDKAETVRELLQGNHKAYLFAQPWNAKEQKKLPTFKNWNDVLLKVGG